MELLPPHKTDTPAPSVLPPPAFAAPTPKQQSWGAMASIIIIVFMIVIGAFYTWGKRIAEERALQLQTTTTTETY